MDQAILVQLLTVLILLYTDVHFESCHRVLKDGFCFVPERTETIMFGRIYTPKTEKVKIRSTGSRAGTSTRVPEVRVT